jgi:tetratricopeptide (TPR) repeat protein
MRYCHKLKPKRLSLPKHLLVGILLLFVCQITNAQISKEEDEKANAYYEQAIKLIHAEKYVQAEVLFVKIFKMNVVMPDDICYHYGKTLFEVKKYTQAQSFLERYNRLKGENGEFYLTSLQLLLEIEKATDPGANKECEMMVRDTCHVCHGNGLAYLSCTRCEGHGKIICDLCKGNKVTIEYTSFGERYFTCSRCVGTGVISCPLCEGTKLEKRKCTFCLGRKWAFYRRRCVHAPSKD